MNDGVSNFNRYAVEEDGLQALSVVGRRVLVEPWRACKPREGLSGVFLNGAVAHRDEHLQSTSVKVPKGH